MTLDGIPRANAIEALEWMEAYEKEIQKDCSFIHSLENDLKKEKGSLSYGFFLFTVISAIVTGIPCWILHDIARDENWSIDYHIFTKIFIIAFVVLFVIRIIKYINFVIRVKPKRKKEIEITITQIAVAKEKLDEDYAKLNNIYNRYNVHHVYRNLGAISHLLYTLQCSSSTTVKEAMNKLDRDIELAEFKRQNEAIQNEVQKVRNEIARGNAESTQQQALTNQRLTEIRDINHRIDYNIRNGY